ncbi:uncharacterized protein LOC124626096 [Tachysurus ichikawai]
MHLSLLLFLLLNFLICAVDSDVKLDQKMLMTKPATKLAKIECIFPRVCYFYLYWYQKKENEAFKMVQKLFGSGTKLYVTDTLKDQVKTPQVAVYQVSKPLQNKKRVLLCQAKGMFPDLVRFTWQAEDQSGKKVELKDDEQLEQRDDNPEIRITSMLIVDKDKLRSSTFTCSVQHDNSVEDQRVIVPRGNKNSKFNINFCTVSLIPHEKTIVTIP